MDVRTKTISSLFSSVLDLTEMVLKFFLLISLLSVACSHLTWDDKTWLNGKEIMTDLAEVGISGVMLTE